MPADEMRTSRPNEAGARSRSSRTFASSTGTKDGATGNVLGPGARPRS
jgi:hypothetical protein